MDRTRLSELGLRLELGHDVPMGWLVIPDGGVERFDGWLDLTALLDRMVHAPSIEPGVDASGEDAVGESR